MNNKTKGKSQSRYSPDEIIMMLDQFDRDNISLKEFCSDKGISQATFFNWRKRYLDRKISNNSVDYVDDDPGFWDVDPPD